MSMAGRTSSRGSYGVRVLAVHTTEGIMRAADLRAWSSWPGSSHASADETGVLLAGAGDGFVDYSRASWTLRSGNAWSENIELCGFARWSRAEWLSRPKLLDACARWLGSRSKVRGIPLVKLSPQQYRAGGRGVIGHHDHTVGYSDGTHWDPGPHFPWDHVLDAASKYAGGGHPEEDDMTPEQAKQLNDMAVAVGELRWGVLDPTQGLRVSLARVQAAILAAIGRADANDAPDVLAAAVVAALPERGTGDGGSLTPGDVEGAVRRVLGSLDAQP